MWITMLSRKLLRDTAMATAAAKDITMISVVTRWRSTARCRVITHQILQLSKVPSRSSHIELTRPPTAVTAMAGLSVWPRDCGGTASIMAPAMAQLTRLFFKQVRLITVVLGTHAHAMGLPIRGKLNG